MANEVDYSPIKYVGNGSTVDFSFDWKVIDTDELIVELENIETGETTVQTRGSDYTATINSVGGAVTFTTAPTSEYYVVLSRATSQYQLKSYSTSTGFQGSEVEKSFDKVSCNLQEMDYNIETFKEEFTEEINETISSFEEDVNTQIAENKAELEAEVEEFESEINSNLTQVYNAVEQLNRLDEILEECETLAETATEQAAEAAGSAASASETLEEITTLAQELEENIENLADTSLSNLVQTGENKLNYNVFSVNSGDVNDDGTPAFISIVEDEDEGTSVLTTSGEFVVTTAAGVSYTITDTLTLDISDYEDGTYNVYINPVDLSLSVLDNTITSGITFPDDAEDGDYLLNTAKVPYDLQKINITTGETTDEDTEETTTETDTTITTGLTDVYAGVLTISSESAFLTLNRYNSDFLSSQSEIGKPEITLSDELSDNEIWLEGAEAAIASYPLLYKIYGDTYGTASTDGYFVLPDFRDRALWGGEDFGYLDAGLPDVYGYMYMSRACCSLNAAGAFSESYTNGSSAPSSISSAGDAQIYFYASSYNSIYGSSDTVQPPAIKVCGIS